MSRVTTGFSQPYVAVYSANGTTVTYSSGMKLARGVDVSITPNGITSDSKFYADNQLAETAAGSPVFTDGTFDLTVDGLSTDAEKLIYGLPAADTNGWTAYGDEQTIPYVALGFIERCQLEGSVKYVPVILTKCQFALRSNSAATQEETVNFQTQSLSGNVFRDDSANHNWKKEGAECDTEEAALAKLKAILSITAE